MSNVEVHVLLIDIVEVLAPKQLIWLGRQRVEMTGKHPKGGTLSGRNSHFPDLEELALLEAFSRFRLIENEYQVWALVEKKYLVVGPRTTSAWLNSLNYLSKLAGADVDFDPLDDLQEYIVRTRFLRILFFPNPKYRENLLHTPRLLDELRHRDKKIHAAFSRTNYFTYAEVGELASHSGFSWRDEWVDLRWISESGKTVMRRADYDG
jgi:hypothetical protein